MVASILDGKTLAANIQHRIACDVNARAKQGHRAPGLAVIRLGDDPASALYVANKRTACHAAGFHSTAYHLPIETNEAELLSLIDTLNVQKDIDGILVQLPLPPHINVFAIIEHIDPNKDVDGFHPYNLGQLAQGHPKIRPCTPYGVMTLLNHYDLSVAGKHAVVIGASNIVGRPMALELLHAKATVTICHRQTQHLESHVRMADLVVVATGTFPVIQTEWLHSKQIIIDVGIHRDANGRLHGDVDFHEAQKKVAWITPVPGGVGPMTIATLLHNTLLAATYFSI
jgi:methylenetetrahydrofolate dehydrogenase (NADP+) / methenyltetrahydrofolate cyclohydrolase